MKITGYMHVACMGHWRDVVTEQLAKIKSSGLYRKTDRICVTVVGADHVDSLFDEDKFDVRYFSDLTEFEFPSLRRIEKSDGDLVWYIHTKGVSQEQDSSDWRRYMEYFIIERHEDCIAALADQDVCGVDHVEVPSNHFMGNFWWARVDYIRRLPSVDEFVSDEHISYVARIMDLKERHKAEFWLMANDNVRIKKLFESHCNHHNEPFPAERYEGVEYKGVSNRDEGRYYHMAGDIELHRGNRDEAKRLWGLGAAIGHEQCRKNLEWAETW